MGGPSAYGWVDLVHGHGANSARYAQQYPGYGPPPSLQPVPVAPQIDVRTTTGLPWYMHVAFAFWAMLTCGYGIKHWVRAWSRAKRVSRSRSR